MRDYVSVISDVKCEGRNFLRVITVFVSWSNHYPSVKCLFFLLTDSYTVHCAGFSYHTRADFRLQKTFISHLFHLHFFFFLLTFLLHKLLPGLYTLRIKSTLRLLHVTRLLYFLSDCRQMQTFSFSMGDHKTSGDMVQDKYVWLLSYTHTHFLSFLTQSLYPSSCWVPRSRYTISEWCLWNRNILRQKS